MAKPFTHSNSSPRERLKRVLVHGLREISSPRAHKSLFDEVGRTYYLLENGDIVNFRQYHQMNRPNYVVSGSKQGCLSHQQRNLRLA